VKHLPVLILIFLSSIIRADDLPVIREISLIRNPIFDPDDPVERRWPYRLANSLHITTKEGFIRSALLFREGDLYDPLLLEAAERRLRNTGFFNPVSITAVPLPDGNVRVEVRTRETWTLNPGASFSSYSGNNSISFEVEESNFLGWGKKVIARWENSVEQERGSIHYEDPVFLSDRNHLTVGLWKTSDGEGHQLFYHRPFMTRKQGASFRAGFLNSDDRVLLYWKGEEALEFILHRDWAVVEGMIRLWGQGDRVLRGGGGFSSLETSSSTWEDHGGDHPFVLDRPRKDRLGFFSLEYMRQRYLKTQGLYAFQHDEDTLLGPRARFGFGFSEGGRMWIYSDAEIGWGTPRHQILGKGVLNREMGGDRRTFYLAGFQAAHQWSTSSTSIMAVRMDGYLHPAGMEVLYLDAEEGLRGIPFRNQAGTRRAQLTFQHKVLLFTNVLHLMNIGAAGFADIGKIWGLERNFDEAEIQRTIGVGLRIESLRSGFATLARLDLGYDLKDGGWEISITTDEWFDWRVGGYLPDEMESPSHAMWWVGR